MEGPCAILWPIYFAVCRGPRPKSGRRSSLPHF